MIRFFITNILFLILFKTSNAQNINIAIFSNMKIQEFSFKSDSGKYDIISDNKIIMQLDENDMITFRIRNNKFKIHKKSGFNFSSYRQIQIRGRRQNEVFTIIPSDPAITSRSYENDLYVTVSDGAFRLINDVNFEKYIAGVVESEGGSKALNEYYKTQAILCRTYALKYFDKHLESGFNLCDDVHCQAYHGRCFHNKDIYKSAIETAGLVIVDENLKVISATFYANSGGETANSEDVWTNKVSYLRSIPDQYSVNQPGYLWEKKISVKSWSDYLNSKKIKASSNPKDFIFTQKNRKKDYVHNAATIPLKTIRADWGLRSTFFNITLDGDQLLFKGKGYGHGVGLSQEGAMQMAKLGFNYESIIKHYYTNVKIMSIKALDFFQIE